MANKQAIVRLFPEGAGRQAERELNDFLAGLARRGEIETVELIFTDAFRKYLSGLTPITPNIEGYTSGYFGVKLLDGQPDLISPTHIAWEIRYSTGLHPAITKSSAQWLENFELRAIMKS